jgi:hypothetical protein
VALFLGNRYLPGKTCPGFPDSKGKILTYKINGLLLYFITVSLYFLLKFSTDFTIIPLIKFFWAFFTAASLYGMLFSILILIIGR